MKKSKLFWALERARSYKASSSKGDVLNQTEQDLIVLADVVKTGDALATMLSKAVNELDALGEITDDPVIGPGKLALTKWAKVRGR